MRTIIAGIVAFGLMSVSAGAVIAEPCDRPQDTAGVVMASVTILDGKDVLGRTAFSCGHFWSAANLIEKSLVENRTVLERFNLAAAYARTGRYDEAESLYQSVMDDGDFIDARMDTAAAQNEVPVRGFNLAEEAGRRRVALVRMRSLLVRADTPSNLSALDAGTDAADITRPGTSTPPEASDTMAQISDAQALARDGLSLPGH